MCLPRTIGFVRSPFKYATEIPEGLGAKHEAEGVLNFLQTFVPVFVYIEGYSHPGKSISKKLRPFSLCGLVLALLLKGEDVFMDISSVLGAVKSAYDSSSSTSGETTSSSSSIDFSSMTISQIRDMTDKMALEGKLSGDEQVELICNGLQDFNAADKSYQPEAEGAYSRSDTNTYNVGNMINDYAEFDSKTGNINGAAIWTGAAQAIRAYEDSSDTTSTSSVNATA